MGVKNYYSQPECRRVRESRPMGHGSAAGCLLPAPSISSRSGRAAPWRGSTQLLGRVPVVLPSGPPALPPPPICTPAVTKPPRRAAAIKANAVRRRVKRGEELS